MMKRLSSRKSLPMKEMLQRIDRVAGDLNVLLVVIAIGLATLDLTFLVTQNVVNHLPPVTRVVLDLNGPQPFQVFPSGRTVIVKVGDSGTETAGPRSGSGPALVNTNYPTSAAHLSVPTLVAPPKSKLLVSFQGGQLSISSNKANLSEVLFAIHEKTGAEIAIPAGAEQEQVVAEFGPAPAPEVVAHLLNGSKFNFLILSSASDPQALDRVILSSRPEGPMPSPRPQPRVVADEAGQHESTGQDAGHGQRAQGEGRQARLNG